MQQRNVTLPFSSQSSKSEFSRCFPTEILYTILISPILATGPTHRSLLNVATGVLTGLLHDCINDDFPLYVISQTLYLFLSSYVEIFF